MTRRRAEPPPAPLASDDSPADQALFSYGTLQQAEVQLDVFGRRIASDVGVLPGYTIDYAEIEDRRVIEVSGQSVHPIVRATGNALDKIVGRLLWITEDELEAADEYEVGLYRRVAAPLASGLSAWVYVSA